MDTPAARAARSVLYPAISRLFHIAPRLLYRVRVEGAGRYRQRPSTLIVVNHKRDLDSVIMPPTLLYNGVVPRRPLWFAGREDMFFRGYLAGYTVVPRPLRRLLHEIDLTPVLGGLRILPIRRFRERTMDEALREAAALFGNRPLEEVLTPEETRQWRHLPASGPAPSRLEDLLHWRFHGARRRPATLRAFAPGWRERLHERQEEVVSAQITALAEVLRRGECLYLAPEGVISPDGRLQAFRSGLRRILTEAGAPVRLLPACVVYDFMRPGRLHVHITVGEEVAAEAPPPLMEAEARRAIASLHLMTASQVVSRAAWGVIVSGREMVRLSELTGAARATADDLRGDGARIEESLAGAHIAEAVEVWARYLERKGWVSRRGSELRLDSGRLSSVPATHWENPIRYCVNEVESVREALAPAPPVAPAAASR